MTNKLSGVIYGYMYEGNWIYVGQTTNVEKRSKDHARSNRSYFDRGLRILNPQHVIGPIVLENIRGKNDKDLDFNLHWNETVWMFALNTYQKIWSKGFNIGLPKGEHYRSMSKSQIGIPKIVRNPSSHAVRVACGKLGAIALHSRHSDKVQGWAKQGSLAAGTLGHHSRWHINRNILSPKCEHCIAA